MENSFECAPRSGRHEAGLLAEHRAFLRNIEILRVRLCWIYDG
jgi:hypothetical protein